MLLHPWTVAQAECAPPQLALKFAPTSHLGPSFLYRFKQQAQKCPLGQTFTTTPTCLHTHTYSYATGFRIGSNKCDWSIYLQVKECDYAMMTWIGQQQQ